MVLKAIYFLGIDNNFFISESIFMHDSNLFQIIREATKGSITLMGRITYEKHFQNRKIEHQQGVKIVLRNEKDAKIKESKWTLLCFNDFQAFYDEMKDYKGDIFVIGGAETIQKIAYGYGFDEVHVIALTNHMKDDFRKGKSSKFDFIPKNYVLKDLQVHEGYCYLTFNR